MNLQSRATIALVLALVPIGLYALFIALPFLVFLANLYGADAFRLTILEPLAIFAIQTMHGLAGSVPLGLSAFGVVIGYSLSASEPAGERNVRAVRAFYFGLAGIPMYAIAFVLWFGWGR